MQFPVPQFLDVEDKIFGPFSLKQFGFIFVGGLIDVLLFRVLQMGITFIILALPITLLTAFLAFGKFNGKAVYNQIPALLKYMTGAKILVFHKTAYVDNLDIQPITLERYKEIVVKNEPVKVAEEEPQSKLKRLSRLLDQKTQEEEEITGDRNKE